jgi:Cu(I)/Ag(I) efflux system membrane fusion protein
VQYDQDKLVHIHPRIQGWVDKLYTRSSGDPIKKGQALYEIYSPQLVNAQEELLLAIQRSTSDQATLNSGNNRLIDAARDRLKALQLDDSFIALLMRNKKVQQTVTFYSPQDGVIDNLNIQEGFYVQPGTTMMSIGALDDVWVEAEIFERQASLIKVGLPVTMMLDYLPGRSWQGTIDYVYPTLDAKTRTLRLRLRFANNDGALKPNMFARLEIHSNREENLLVVPREAVIRTGNQDRVVLALGEGRFKSVAVELGRLDGNFAEILGGLVAGEKVVTSAQFLLDSESSKTSDFMRMAHSQNTGANTNEKPKSVWVAGSIVAAMPEQKSVTAAHEAIAEWDWPEMTMDFSVAEDVDFKQLSQGTVLHMEITELDNHQYQISAIHIMATGKSSAGNDNLEIDPQPTLNHSDKDHGQLEQNSGGDQ